MRRYRVNNLVDRAGEEPTLADRIAGGLGALGERDTSQEWTPAMQGGSAPAAMREQRPNFGKRLLSGLQDYARSGDFDFAQHDDGGGFASSLLGSAGQTYGGIQNYRQARGVAQQREGERVADRSLHERLINSEILKNDREPYHAPQNIDPLSPPGIDATVDRDTRLSHIPLRPRAGGRGATDPNAVDQRLVMREADRLFDDGYGDYEKWDDAYAEALHRAQTAGRLGGANTPKAGGDRGGAPNLFQTPTSLKDYLTNRAAPSAAAAGGGTGQDEFAQARGLVKGMAPAAAQQALRQAGYSSTEITRILGGQ
jgi:hypothetical protein